MNSSRRQFLKNSLILGSGVMSATLVNTIAFKIGAGFIQQARSEEQGFLNDPRSLLTIWINSGPTRFSFDQWVRPYDDSLYFKNPTVSTAYVHSAGNKLSGIEYKTFKHNGINVPHLFSNQVYNGAGQLRSAKEILDHMYVLRGFGTSFDGHDTNALIVQTPVTGLPSLSGLLADETEKLFAAVSMGGVSGFTSLKNKSATIVDFNTYLKGLMKSFDQSPEIAKTMVSKQTHTAAYETVMSYLKQYARSNRLGASTLNKNLENASAKLKQGIKDIDSYWPGAVARYQTAIEKTARMTDVPGISDKPILRGKDQFLPYQFRVHGLLDGLGQFTVNTGEDYDVRQMTTNMNFSGLYEQMAVAEYCLLNNLTPSIRIGTDAFLNTKIRTSGSPDDSDPKNHEFFLTEKSFTGMTDMDSGMGAYVNLMLTNQYYSAILAGILELKDVLSAHNHPVKSTNMWNETVVQVSSEFARYSYMNGVTNSHGYQSMVTSAFSGAIQNGPYISGNIAANANVGNGSDGTNGFGAPIENYPVSGIPTPATATSSISKLLRVHSNPWENTAPSLIDFNDSTGEIRNLFGRAKNVG